MKGLIWLGLCSLFALKAQAQSIDLKEFTDLLELGQSRLETQLQKKGFHRAPSEEGSLRYIREEKAGSPDYQVRGFEIVPSGSSCALAYETTCAQEYRSLLSTLSTAGFSCPEKIFDTTNILYQRANISIRSCRRQEDTVLFYVLKAYRKLMPRKKEIVAAEDLLQLDGQEYLVDVFGRENVKTDWFFYDDRDSNICSVLFPHTEREAIFVWKDQANMSEPVFILIGGELRSSSSSGPNMPTSTNSWISRQGIYCGMTITELERMNGTPVRFYNWRGASAGYLAPDNKGSVDFSQLGLVFNCMNCAYIKSSADAITDSGQARTLEQKVYVTTLIILPPKKNGQEIHE